MKTTEPIRDKNQIAELVNYHLQRGQIRNHILIVLALHTALRSSDLLLLRWDDIYDFTNRRFRGRITLTEKKTGKSKSIPLHTDIIAALQLYLEAAKPGGFLFANPRTGKALSRSQLYRIIRAAGEAIGIDGSVSGHSLRKTLGYQQWKAGKDPAIIMKVYNHSSLAITSRYLGITQDDIDTIYLTLTLTA